MDLVTIDHARHTVYSHPGRHAARLQDALAGETGLIENVSALARNAIVHYRASGETLPEASSDDIQLRWLEDILEADQRRHPAPLTVPRDLTQRVQGCCRDHTLLCVGALRELGIPARSRIGFAGYFSPTWHHDHVIVEARLEDRWVRFDPELDRPTEADPFLTAAQVWLGHRDGTLDVTRFGTFEGSPIAGDWFVFNYVIDEVAHRFGDELLLWDLWGAKVRDLAEARPADLTLIDQVARLLLASDAGDQDAERELLTRYRQDPRLHPGGSVVQLDPRGGPEEAVMLRSTRG